MDTVFIASILGYRFQSGQNSPGNFKIMCSQRIRVLRLNVFNLTAPIHKGHVSIFRLLSILHFKTGCKKVLTKFEFYMRKQQFYHKSMVKSFGKTPSTAKSMYIHSGSSVSELRFMNNQNAQSSRQTLDCQPVSAHPLL